jgi:hypothetical protein
MRAVQRVVELVLAVVGRRCPSMHQMTRRSIGLRP